MLGNLAAEWKRFRGQWLNYETAADLADATTRKRAAVFLACVGTEAYEPYQTMQFESDEASKEIDNIIDAFERHCVGGDEREVRAVRVQPPGAGTCPISGMTSPEPRRKTAINRHSLMTL